MAVYLADRRRYADMFGVNPQDVTREKLLELHEQSRKQS